MIWSKSESHLQREWKSLRELADTRTLLGTLESLTLSLLVSHFPAGNPRGQATGQLPVEGPDVERHRQQQQLSSWWPTHGRVSSFSCNGESDPIIPNIPGGQLGTGYECASCQGGHGQELVYVFFKRDADDQPTGHQQKGCFPL